MSYKPQRHGVNEIIFFWYQLIQFVPDRGPLDGLSIVYLTLVHVVR